MKKNILLLLKKILLLIGDTYHLTKVYLNYLCSSWSQYSRFSNYIMVFSFVILLLNNNLTYSQIVIDGNPSEWPGVLNNAANTKKAFKHDPFNATGVDDQWTQGSKDTDASPTTNWKWVYGNSNDKGDIGNAGAVLLGTKLYFFGDRAAFNGDSQIGFWFFLDDVMPTGSGASASPFTGEHSNGDILIISNFTNGGGIVQPLVYMWSGKTANNPGALVQVNPNTVLATLASNDQSYNVPGGANGTQMFNGDVWTFSPKSGPANTYPVPLFFEGSLDLATIQGISPCFKRFLLETRNSQSLTASLQDLAAGGFSGVPPAPSVVAGNRCGPGSVTLSASGCLGTLNWYANATGGASLGTGPSFNTTSISQTTTFYVSCTVDGCEGSRAPVIATINPTPSASASYTPINCYGGNSTITVSASGGTPSYTYSLDNVTFQAGNTFVVPAGSYTVYVKDSKGCPGEYQVNISQPDPSQPDISIGPFAKSYCGLPFTEAQSQLNADFTSWLNSIQIINTGTLPYTLVRSPQNPTPPAVNGGETSVSWTITDACGKSETISEIFTVLGCNIICELDTDPTPCNVAGSITASGSGGFPQYSFKLYLTSDVTFTNQIGATLFSANNPGIVTFTGLAAGDYTVLIFDQVQNTNDSASACSILVTRDPPPLVTTHCSNDQFNACGQTQEALNADYTSWFNSLAPTGGTNLQYSIEVKDAQGNVVDIDGIFAPNKCGAVYTATVTYSDACAQSGSCQGVYTVVGDTQPPVITTQNQSGDLGCNPTSIVAPSFGYTDNCDSNLQVSVSDGGVQTNGCGRSRTWTATLSDGCGNAATPVSITYTWKVDTQAPVISTQNQSGDLGCNPQSIPTPTFSYTDNCDNNLQVSVNDGGLQTNGCGRSRTWTATLSDGCGNAAVPVSITYTWKVDTQAPVISTQSQSGDLGCNPQSIPTPSFSYTDNCDNNLQVSVNDGGLQTNGCGRSRTWTATLSDGCGNTAIPVSITYTWKVDTQAPVISTQSQSGDLGCNPQSIPTPSFSYTDNCDNNLQVSVNDGGLQTNGCGRSRTWTASLTDSCGNVATPVSITYTWKVDTQAPVISTQSQSGYLGCNPQSIPTPTFSYTDNCDNNLQVSVSDGGLQTNGCGRSRTWTASLTDSCGNAAVPVSITYTWKVDTQAPVISTQSQSGDLGCNPQSIPTPSFSYTDNCDNNLQVSVNDGGVQTNGCGRSRTWTASLTDSCGNAAVPVSITYTWKVDTQAPVITSQSQSGDLGCNPESIPTPSFSYTDNCDNNLQVSVNDGGVQNEGCNYSHTWTASVTDSCGNVATPKSITYSWKVDTQAPVFTCPDNYTLNGCDTQPIIVLPLAIDNCDGEIIVTAERSDDLALNAPFPVDQTLTITYTAVDGCGNTASCDFTVFVTPCVGDTNCTYTQGFYGNYKGKGCSPTLGQTGSQDMMVLAVSNNGGVVDFGSVPNNNYFRLLLSDINGNPVVGSNNIYKMLPGGGTPRALIGFNTYSVGSTWADNDPLNAGGSNKGKINNVLLAQTMALFFNMGNDPALSNVKLEETFATADVTYCGSDTIIPGTTQIFNIDISVINYLDDQYGEATVGTLYQLANKALGGGSISPLNHSVINSAVDNINRGFDECRAQVSVPTETISVIEKTTDKDFTIYPVPFISNFKILYNFDYKSPVEIQVFDSRGTLLFSKYDSDTYKGKELLIDFPLTHQKGEVFFIRIETNRGHILKNIVSSTN
ncbi:Ig-like domain-containing protein [Flavobacterium urocaniciphilum]|uniref:HYR domain-containing protein n=1 Tax=Flavobacterium urocaniciphilum TaxID=1299341 RepID=A0A1H8YRP6_9FLAO|nr:HYR domain-containing protein [Flavobacterium urocaniciphilum]SEP54681.1 HYR domain-containing protein [Flavobacterium urocaniciphilum]